MTRNKKVICFNAVLISFHFEMFKSIDRRLFQYYFSAHTKYARKNIFGIIRAFETKRQQIPMLSRAAKWNSIAYQSKVKNVREKMNQKIKHSLSNNQCACEWCKKVSARHENTSRTMYSNRNCSFELCVGENVRPIKKCTKQRCMVMSLFTFDMSKVCVCSTEQLCFASTLVASNIFSLVGQFAPTVRQFFVIFRLVLLQCVHPQRFN